MVLRAGERHALGLWVWPWHPGAWHIQVEVGEGAGPGLAWGCGGSC